jgi:hypothetical protein
MLYLLRLPAYLFLLILAREERQSNKVKSPEKLPMLCQCPKYKVTLNVTYNHEGQPRVLLGQSDWGFVSGLDWPFNIKPVVNLPNTVELCRVQKHANDGPDMPT